MCGQTPAFPPHPQPQSSHFGGIRSGVPRHGTSGRHELLLDDEELLLEEDELLSDEELEELRDDDDRLEEELPEGLLLDDELDGLEDELLDDGEELLLDDELDGLGDELLDDGEELLLEGLDELVLDDQLLLDGLGLDELEDDQLLFEELLLEDGLLEDEPLESELEELEESIGVPWTFRGNNADAKARRTPLGESRAGRRTGRRGTPRPTSRKAVGTQERTELPAADGATVEIEMEYSQQPAAASSEYVGDFRDGPAAPGGHDPTTVDRTNT